VFVLFCFLFFFPFGCCRFCWSPCWRCRGRAPGPVSTYRPRPKAATTPCRPPGPVWRRPAPAASRRASVPSASRRCTTARRRPSTYPANATPRPITCAAWLDSSTKPRASFCISLSLSLSLSFFLSFPPSPSVHKGGREIKKNYVLISQTRFSVFFALSKSTDRLANGSFFR